ncbi:signal peptide peptidase-like, aspartyl protease family A22B [Thraustotheca clavata]|uniref:Signal peptide peptidase-like, aspartyl protease family A22B n=1 Tax=Thraustotheca clavata TaxID=74557 RepID=A0A1V9Z2J6_9STRA|nr:signal peptide peptidase-like, aspartyl protease family A22B [Thraustotheca clavata]
MAGWRLWGLMLLYLHQVDAIVPSGVLELIRPNGNATSTMFVAPSYDSGWGPLLSDEESVNGSHKYLLAQAGDSCNGTLMNRSVYAGKIIVANRGNCSFLTKAIVAQKLGATGLIIRNTRQAVFLLDRNRSSLPANNTLDAMPPFATDCSQGEDYIDALDPVMPWMVHSTQCTKNCASNICIPTGYQNESLFQVCCMWDTHLLMGANYTIAKSLHLQFPIVFATVNEGETLTKLLSVFTTMKASIYARSVPLIGVSSIILWAMGVATAIGGAYYSAASERSRFGPKRSHSDSHASEEEEDDEEVLDLSFKHAIGFIVCAGIFLTFLYFVHVGAVLSILFGLSSVSTVTLLITYALMKRLCPCIQSWHVRLPIFGSITVIEILAFTLSLCLVIAWFLQRESLWYLQDLFGITLCFVFLKTIRLPNLKIAALLLVLAFFYDIFFVFISPLIFGRSVMVDVATGGLPASARDGYPGVDTCERYPDYSGCVEPDPLPMLLVFPRVFDWRQGRAMLGLGDIVLPGLLLSFALRFDYTRRVHLKLDANAPNRFFLITSIGYAFGLAFANIAVVLMKMGQPALLYLVPCTLGGIILTSYCSNDLHQMWHEGLYTVHPLAPIISESIVDLEASDDAPLLHEKS